MMKYRADIDGLRAVAIVAIVLYHADISSLPGGFIGVDVFFVISGYLITTLLTRELEATGTIAFTQFYTRRARRLLPALGLAVICTLAAICILLSPLEVETAAKTAIATALYVSNFYFINQAVDYFSPNSQHDPLLHTWSLGVEEQFYILWPLFVFVGYRLGSKRAITAFCATTIALSLAAWLEVSPTWAFYSSPTRAWELGIGALCSFASLQASPLKGTFIGVAGLAAIASYAAMASASDKLAMVVPVLGTAAILVSGNGSGSLASWILGIWPMRMVGRISYGWYLWHWPVLVLVQQSLEVWLPMSTRLWCIAASFALAILSYVLVEQPVRTSKPLLRRPAFTMTLAAAVTVILVAGSSLGRWFAAEAIASNPQYQALWAAASEPRPCMQWQSSELLECSYGNPNSEINLVLTGDSLAGEWAPVLATIAEQQHWKLTTLLMGECPLMDIFPSVTANCREWQRRVWARIENRQPSLVITSFSRIYPLWTGQDRFDEALHDTLSRVSSFHIPIAVIAPTPMGGVDALRCMMRPRWLVDERRCDSQRKYVIDDKLVSSLHSIAGNLPGVQVWDLNNHFCDDIKCPAIKNGTLVYSDTSHASIPFLRTLSPELLSKMRAILNGAS
jgi:peptidoglycan/LPS O-acetylase OafA/YrhL